MKTFTPNFDALLRPSSVAIIGASTDANKVGGVPVSLLKSLGYAGRIIPVNPVAAEVQGLPAVASILDVPGPVDLAIVCVPQSAAAQVLADCARAGVKSVIMFTSGFAEIGATGAQAQLAIQKIAADASITLLGPNCFGAMNLRNGVFATFSPVPRAGVPPMGSIGLVSQSGAFGAYAFTLARKNGLGISQWVTTGNEAGVQAADVIEWMAKDDETKVILAYLEGCKDGPRLVRALHAARKAGKPVVITKVGRTSAGARAAMSHTASLAGEDRVFNAVFDECGAVRAYTIEEFFRYGQLFATAKMPASDAVAIITVSGGVGTLMADRAEELGLKMPALNEVESDKLKTIVPFCSTINPIDVTGQVGSHPALLTTTCDIVASSGRYSGASLFVAAGAYAPHFWPTLRESVEILTSDQGMTVTVSGLMTEEQRKILMSMGCLVYEEPTQAIEAFAVLRSYARKCAAADVPCTAIGPSNTLPPAGSMNEAQALAFVQSAGVEVAPFGIACSAVECAELAAKFNAPVVVKVLSRDLLHKSDVGGVRLNVRTSEDASKAFSTILADVGRAAPHARVEGVLVAKMIKPVLECMVGASLDPIFGPIVVFGLGGTEVEWLNRVAVATAPVAPTRVRELLNKMGILQRLEGWRGSASIDPQALISAICAVSDLAARADQRLKSLEINPLMVTADGTFAADAVVELVGA